MQDKDVWMVFMEAYCFKFQLKKVKTALTSTHTLNTPAHTEEETHTQTLWVSVWSSE